MTRRTIPVTIPVTILVTALATAPLPWSLLSPAARGETLPPLLPETVVTASPVDVPRTGTGISVEVIDQEALRVRAPASLADALQDVPGISVTRQGSAPGLASASIRGGPADHLKVIIDGLPFRPELGGVDLSQISVAGIRRIEVLRGPQATLWGGNAASGVISIITADSGFDTPFSGSVRAGAGSHGVRQHSFSAGGGSEAFYLHLSGHTGREGGFSSADRANGNTERDSLSTLGLNLKAGIRPAPDLTIEARLYRIDNEGEYDSAATLPPADEPPDQHFTYDYRHRIARLEANYGGERLSHRIGITRDRQRRDSRDSFPFSSTQWGTALDYRFRLRFDTPALADGRHLLVLGAGRERLYYRTSYTTADRAITVSGFSAGLNSSLGERLHLVAEIRHDRSASFRNGNSHRLAATIDLPVPGLRFHTSVSDGWKRPEFYELYGYSNNFSGNPDLQPERIRGQDAGIEATMAGGRLVADLTLFRSRARNLIAGAGRTVVNLPGNSRFQGYELSLRARPLPDIILHATFTRQSRADDPDGVRLVRRPRNRATAGITWQPQPDLSLHLGGRWQGKSLDNDSYFPVVTRTTIPAFAVFRLAVDWTLWPGLSLTGRITNLLDRRYQEVFGYGTGGRTIYLGLRGEF